MSVGGHIKDSKGGKKRVHTPGQLQEGNQGSLKDSKGCLSDD